MGMFDDLVPASTSPEYAGGRTGGVVSFSDLIPPQIDFDRDIGAVRADIAKLSGPARDAALKAWGEAYVKKEKASTAGTVLGAVDDTARTLARGTFVGPWLDEITAKTQGALHGITGGALGAPEDETLAYQRARDSYVDTNSPVLSTVGQIAGGVAGGGAALKGGGTLLDRGVKLATGGPLAAWTPAASLAGRTGQGVAIGSIYGANAGMGNAEGDIGERWDKGGATGAAAGAVLGGALPTVLQGAGKGIVAANEMLSPQLARMGGQAKSVMEKIALRAGPEPKGPVVSAGADAAAEQVIANQLARSNVTAAQLRQRMLDANDAARMGTNSRAAQLLAPVDLDPSLQRLAGSVMRQQPEAANLGAAFQYARQTGQPSGLPLPVSANVPVRPPLAKPQPGDPPMGQFERTREALRRALQISDADHHGIGRTAYATENMIVNRARIAANKLYGKAYKSSEGVDIRPVIAPVMEKWAAEAAEQPEAVSRAIKTMLRQFTTAQGPVSTLQRFQKSKEFADGLIKKWFESPESRNKYVGGLLSTMQKELLAAIDEMPKAGPAYKMARETFSDEMKLRNALKTGREVFRDNSEVVVDQYRSLSTAGERRMFRIGLLDSYAQQMGRKSRANDVTQIFASPRVQEILQEIIPRSKGKAAEFADRPERFGQFLANEKRMVETRNKTMGNSLTAERLADDQALDNMQSMVEAAKQSLQNPSATGLMMRGLDMILNKTFGFRADTAAAVAQKLYTASPREQALLWGALEERLGPSRSEHLARLMREYQGAIQQSATGATGASGATTTDRGQ